MLLQPKDIFVKSQEYEFDGFTEPVKLYYITPAHLILLNELRHPLFVNGDNSNDASFIYQSEIALVVLSIPPEEIVSNVEEGHLQDLAKRVKLQAAALPPVDIKDILGELLEIPESIKIKKKTNQSMN